jgi:hypothetical protein
MKCHSSVGHAASTYWVDEVEGKACSLGQLPLRKHGPRWIELKDKALPTRSSRPSQGESEIHRTHCIPSPCPNDSIPPNPVGQTDTNHGMAGWTFRLVHLLTRIYCLKDTSCDLPRAPPVARTRCRRIPQSKARSAFSSPFIIRSLVELSRHA